MSRGAYSEARFAPGDGRLHFDAVWHVRFDGAVDEWLVLPDGAVDLILVPGRPPLVAGPATAPFSRAAPAASCTAGLRLRAGAVPAVLGVTAEDLRDRVVALADLPRAPRPELGGAWDAVQAGRAGLAGTLLQRAVVAERRAATPDAVVARAAHELRRDPSTSVAAIAALVGYSPRQLRRRFAEHVGYGPKRFARVMRLQRFLALQRAWPHESLGALAAAAGFADHAHLVDDCRALAGRTPQALLQHRAATLEPPDAV